MNKPIIFSVIILVVLILIGLIFDIGRKEPEPTDFKENIAVREIVSESAPLTSDMPIYVSSVKDGQEVLSPIKIVGKARGSWFFEASFPIELVDSDGNTIGRAIATADGDWMTTNFVNFTAELEYKKSTSTNRALLVLNKDNPSDDRRLDQSIFIPVILK